MKKMYVGNIPYNATEEDLRELFSECGEIESLRIMKDQFTGGSKGFGFIEMANENDAKTAMATLNGRDFKGKSLKVAEAIPQQKRQGFNNRGSGYGGGTGRGWRQFPEIESDENHLEGALKILKYTVQGDGLSGEIKRKSYEKPVNECGGDDENTC